MKMNWYLFTDAHDAAAADKLLKRAAASSGVEVCESSVEPYHKGGHKVSFSSKVSAEGWPAIVVEVLSTAQGLGRAWQLSGDIADEVDAWSNEISVSGIGSAHVVVIRDPNL